MTTAKNMRRGVLVLVGALLYTGCSATSTTWANSRQVSTEAADLQENVVSAKLRAPRWLFAGPRLDDGSSGKLNAFAYNPSNPRIMYVAGGWGNTPREPPSEAGIYMTVDGGQHWKASDTGLTDADGSISSAVNGLWVDRANPSIVLAATEFGGTFRSTNGGRNWKNVDGAESTQFAQAGPIIYVATRKGVLLSGDDGASWRLSLPSQAGATTVNTAAGATYAGLADGSVYLLTQNIWKLAGRAGSGAIHDISVDPSNASIAYATVDDKTAANENLYASLDSGATWSRVYCKDCAIGEQAIAFSLVVPGRLYLGADKTGLFYIVADGSQRPTIHLAAVADVDERYIFPVPSTNQATDACYIAADQGLYFAEDCGTGTVSASSFNIQNFLAYSAALPPNARNIVVALQDWDAMSGPGSRVSQLINGSIEGGETVMDPFNRRYCFYAHPDEGLWLSQDGCATFPNRSGTGIESLAFDSAHPTWLYGIVNADRPTATVSVSTYLGASWLPTGWKFSEPYQVLLSPADQKAIVVAAGSVGGQQHLYSSDDSGKSWVETKWSPSLALPSSTELVFPAHGLYAAFEPGQALTVLVADHDPVTGNILIYRSNDGGRTCRLASTLRQPTSQRPWPQLRNDGNESNESSELRDVRFYTNRFFGNRLAFNPDAPRRKTPAVALTTRFGAYVSYDVGSHWQRIDTRAIPHHFIGVSWVNGHVYLASFGGGVLKSAAPLQ